MGYRNRITRSKKIGDNTYYRESMSTGFYLFDSLFSGLINVFIKWPLRILFYIIFFPFIIVKKMYEKSFKAGLLATVILIIILAIAYFMYPTIA